MKAGAWSAPKSEVPPALISAPERRGIWVWTCQHLRSKAKRSGIFIPSHGRNPLAMGGDPYIRVRLKAFKIYWFEETFVIDDDNWRSDVAAWIKGRRAYARDYLVGK